MTWTRDALRIELLEVLRPHAQAGVELSEDSHLVADLGIDSLELMRIIAAIEDRFGIQIPEELLPDVETIGDVANALESGFDGRRRLCG